MRKQAVIIILLAFFSSLNAQQIKLPIREFNQNGILKIVNAEKYSCFTKSLLAELNKRGSINIIDTAIFKKYLIDYNNNVATVQVFLLIDTTNAINELIERNIEPSIVSDNILIATVPLNILSQLGSIDGIKFIQISEPVSNELNNARASTWVNWVHQGYQLPQQYYGNGVVVGIVDGGFDYTHPTFYDTTGTIYRVKRVWEQNATTGTPPNCIGCSYSGGRELATQTAILNAQRDDNTESHGSHVTGIAAGGGAGTSGQYRGVAPMSDIVLVSQGAGDAKAISAMQYIINYANSVNKPVVINNSWGKRFGARDGLSPLDQAINSMTGAGKIIVKSAGNNGGDLHHLSKTFTNTDTVLGTFIRINNTNTGLPPTLANPSGTGTIDIWGGTNSSFKVAAAIVNVNNSYAIEDATPYIGSWTNNAYNFTLTDNDPVFSDYALIDFSTTPIINYNSKPNIQVTVDNTDQDDNYRWIYIEIIAYNTTVHLWGDNGIDFVNLGLGSLGSGNDFYTITEPGNGTQIITIGAYNTTESPIGGIASFSSKGPTSDGRLKPDITAPGNRITSSVNRFDANYLSGGDYWNDVVTGVTNGTNTWYFGKMQGTSMAAPVATGILALWLEAYPNLTPSQAKVLLRDNAWTDSNTGTIPANGSPIWGWGKIDAHEGIKDLLTKIPPQPTITPSGSVSVCQGQTITLSAPSGFSSYLWSNGATTQSINVSSAGSYTVRVTNNQGYISPWSAPKVVTINPKPNAPTFAPTSGCSPLTVTASSSNCTGCSYQWSTGASGTTATFTANTNFTVTVTNSNNCTTSANGSVTITGQPAVAITPANPAFCTGGSVVLTVSPSGSSYSWSGPNGFTSNAQSPSVNMPGTYSVTVTNPGSCSGTATASKSVTQHSSPTANAGNDVTIQQGNSTTLTATGGTSYIWSNGANSASTTVSPTQTTTYTVTVTDANGCTATDNVTVFVQSGGCNNIYTLNTASVNISASGGNTSVNLTTDGGCSWNVNAGGCVGWVTPDNPNGVGSSTVSFSVQPNPLSSQRTCFVTIAGELFTIIQEAAPTTGISEISDIQNISLFPNPNNGKFTLMIESAVHQKLNSNLYNAIGQLVLSREVETNAPIEFDISSNAKGIYFLQIISEQRFMNRKILLE